MEVKNFFSFLYKTTVDLLLYSTIALTLLALVPSNWFPNFPFQPTKYEVVFADNYGSKWTNHLVDKGELLLKEQIVGPESMAIVEDSIYTGLADGRVVEINKKTLKVKEILKIQNKPICDENRLSECGRVLGVKFGKDGHLYGVDYFSGVLRINVTTSEKELIRVGDDVLGYDDLEFDPQLNVIYVSMLSTKWSLNRCLYGLLEPDSSGYLLAFDLNTKKSYKLISGMLFANGIQLSKDQKHLFVAETLKYRILKISLQDIHRAIKEKRELTENEVKTFTLLPGEPDNVRLDPNGDLLVALFSTRRNGKLIHEHLSNWPFVRKAVARAIYTFKVTLDFLNTNLLGSPSVQEFITELDTGKYFVDKLPKSGSVVRINAKTGQITKIYGSEAFNAVTEAVIDSEGDLYFGSFVSSFLGRIKKKDL